MKKNFLFILDTGERWRTISNIAHCFHRMFWLKLMSYLYWQKFFALVLTTNFLFLILILIPRNFSWMTVKVYESYEWVVLLLGVIWPIVFFIISHLEKIKILWKLKLNFPIFQFQSGLIKSTQLTVKSFKIIKFTWIK